MSTLPFHELFSKNGLSLERLQVLAAVAEAGSIANAAESDPTKQGQYSRQLGELSDFFGADILVRDGRGSKLSPLAASSPSRHDYSWHSWTISAPRPQSSGNSSPLLVQTAYCSGS